MKTSEDHRRRQREKLPACTLGHGYVRCCHVGQSRFGQTPLETRKRRGRDEVGRKDREEEGEEQRGEVEQEEIDKKGHRVARSGEPDSMPRVATGGRHEEVEEETSQAQRDRAEPKRGMRGEKRSQGSREDKA